MRKLTTLFLLFIALSSSAYNNLYINNPQTWQYYNAVIDQAEITVKPLGAFVEYSLTLTISAKKPIYENDNAQLEIVMDFELPSNSIICDSWLWIEGKPKQADILDRWTASAIYEEIVNRRKDPSLLVKNGPYQYRINVYPMKPQEARKFKITYLSPAKYSNNKLSIDLPSNILNLSSDKLSSFDAFFISNDFYDEVQTENSELTIQSVNHADYGNCSKISIPNLLFSHADIQLIKAENETLYASKHEDGNEGLYQISFTPSDFVEDDNKAKKICYLIDYDQNYTSRPLDLVLDDIKKAMKETLNENDRFEIIFSKISPSATFHAWMKGTDENIDTAFANHGTSQYSNLITLIGKGIETINKLGDQASIILISNNCNYHNINGANDIISDLNEINENNTAINIIDFAENHYQHVWTSGGSYFNNGYLFTILARKTGGEYISFIDNNNTSFSDRMTESIDLVSGKRITNIDIYTSNKDGFCYARKNISSSFDYSFSYNKSIHHFGKYTGSMPTNLEVSFKMDNELYHFQKDINETKTIKVDSSLITIWSGLDISDLEKQGNSNQTIGEIINISLENRILSYYTAFLCVEDNIEICTDCGDDWNKDVFPGDDGWDGEVVVDVNDIENEVGIKAFPNPFTSSIQIDLYENEELQDLKIFNTVGQCVKTFRMISDQNSYTWDGKSDTGDTVKKGIYILKAIYANKVITIKILKNS